MGESGGINVPVNPCRGPDRDAVSPDGAREIADAYRLVLNLAAGIRTLLHPSTGSSSYLALRARLPSSGSAARHHFYYCWILDGADGSPSIVRGKSNSESRHVGRCDKLLCLCLHHRVNALLSSLYQGSVDTTFVELVRFGGIARCHVGLHHAPVPARLSSDDDDRMDPYAVRGDFYRPVAIGAICQACTRVCRKLSK